jgi:hypothetical protein
VKDCANARSQDTKGARACKALVAVSGLEIA